MTRKVTACLLLLLLVFSSTINAMPELGKDTLAAWKVYVDLTERRNDSDLKNTTVPLRSDFTVLRTGQVQIKPLSTPGTNGKSLEIPDGSVHHWLGAIFIPETNLDKLIPWLQNYSQYKCYFSDLEDSSIRSRNGNELDIFLRMKRSKLGITAHFNTKHHVIYNPRRPGFLSSVSRSTEIRQVRDAGSAQESEYPVGKDSGYLWGLNSYWRFTERDGGIVVESESIGLARDLGWGLSILNFFMLGQFKRIADSIAREALEDTLTGLRSGVRGGPKKAGC